MKSGDPVLSAIVDHADSELDDLAAATDEVSVMNVVKLIAVPLPRRVSDVVFHHREAEALEGF